jgi:hypothetical protein
MSTAAPLSNVDRAFNYAEQRFGESTSRKTAAMQYLTARQLRRIRKHERRTQSVDSGQ